VSREPALDPALLRAIAQLLIAQERQEEQMRQLRGASADPVRGPSADGGAGSRRAGARRS
jgi:hypothetical protein